MSWQGVWRWRSLLPGLVAGILLLALFWIGYHHPWADPVWLVPFALGLMMVWRHPHLGLQALLTLLPVASQTIWSGWRVIDEFDLLLLAVLGVGYGRLARDLCSSGLSSGPRHHIDWRFWLLLAGVLASTGIAAWRAWIDLGPPVSWNAQDWLFGDYDSPANVWRVGKSALWLLLAVPWLHYLARTGCEACARALCRGMLGGLILVCVLAVWERYVYVGLRDFSEPYRTTAWFWEMHVGGGAIDAYLVLASPFAPWALWQARSRLAWAAAALLIMVLVYVVVTTYSRGLYLAVLGSLGLMMIVRHGRQREGTIAAALDGRFARANRWLLAGLGAECLCFFVLATDSFATSRLSHSSRDLVSRWEHWTAAAALLDTPQRRWLGLGLGRLPAHYSLQVPEGELPGQVRWLSPEAGGPAARLAGPVTQARRARSFALVQRVPIGSVAGSYRVRLWVRTAQVTELGLKLCQQHLLYEGDCQSARLRVEPVGAGSLPGAGDSVQGQTIELQGPDLAPVSWPQRVRQGLLSLSVLEAGQEVQLEKVELLSSIEISVLKNADFSLGLSNWLPVATDFFRSWHLDNFYLELWAERGWPGLLAWIALLGFAVRALLWRVNESSCRLPLLGGLTGASALGMVISIAELPRIAFLLALLSFSALVVVKRPPVDCNSC